ncbi:MAG: DUF5615 family PIN-like protein [Tepidisphaeraceae bacterium]
MNVLIDMNLSPDWVGVLCGAGHQAVHWSAVGNPDATDETIFYWAQTHDFVVFTHDLDFGALLAATGAATPSVMQLRTQDTFPDTVGALLLSALQTFEMELRQGALIVVDTRRSRVRVLPIRRGG